MSFSNSCLVRTRQYARTHSHRFSPSRPQRTYTHSTKPHPLKGANCIITGASRGIGRAIALAFSQHDANLLLLGRNTSALQETQSLCHSASPGSLPHSFKTGDVAQRDFWTSLDMAKDLPGSEGRVDVFVHAAGITHSSLFVRTTARLIEEVIQTNLMGAIWGSQIIGKKMLRNKTSSPAPSAPKEQSTALPDSPWTSNTDPEAPLPEIERLLEKQKQDPESLTDIERQFLRIREGAMGSMDRTATATLTPKVKGVTPKGHILFISSLLATHGGTGSAAYSASKASLLGLTRSLAAEMGPLGIRVNTILPGYIESDMTAAMEAGAKEKALARVPMARFGTTEEVADAAVWLAGNAYANNCVVNLDGGLSAV